METQESILAREAAIHFECKKDGLRQTQDGGVKVTFNINPNDMPKQLYTDPMGTRYVIALVALNEDETPRSEPIAQDRAKSRKIVDKPKSHAGEAKLLVKDPLFAEYIKIYRAYSTHMGNAEAFMKKEIGIQSCSELIEGSEAYEQFKALRHDFYSWKRVYEQEQFYTA